MALVNVGNGVELDFERSGSGPPLLMLMGLSGTALTWGEPFLDLLRADFEVIVCDHRGIGASTRLEGPTTIREMAANAAGLLTALDIDSAHLFGISMGGMIAQELTLAHPERVRSLALGCTYCGGEGSVRLSPELARRLREARTSGDRERAVRTSWEANVSARFALDEQAFERFKENALARRVAIEVIREHSNAIGGHDTSKRLGQIEVQTLVVHGTEDQVLPVANGRMVASLIDGSRLEIFDGVGHLFFLERPQRTAELVRENAAVHA
jgi:3-oxoadipate enol-lactonase